MNNMLDKDYGIKLKVIRLKCKNIKLMEYDDKISHVMIRVFYVVWIIVGSHISQGGCYYAPGCVVVMYFGYYYYGLLWFVNIHAVYVLGIGCKILLLLMCMCIPFCTGIVYVIAWFNMAWAHANLTELAWEVFYG
jgi:hypothetical protein